MVLKCERPVSVAGEMRWTVNDQNPTLNPVKYIISDDRSTLTVNNVIERDKGKSHVSLSYQRYLTS